MLNWTEETIRGLGVAINEATLLGLEVDAAGRRVGVTLQVLTLPERGPAPLDATVRLVLSPVGRVAASLRHGLWNDESAAVEPLVALDLAGVVRATGGLPIYGWEFFDLGEDTFTHWSDRLSLDWRAAGGGGAGHTLDLFQAGFAGRQPRHVDVRVWFDDIAIYGPSGDTIPVEAFIAGGRRWWDGLYGGDPRTGGSGIMPLTDNPAPPG